MVSACHSCDSNVAESGDATDGLKEGFECADCGEVTCIDCSSSRMRWSRYSPEKPAPTTTAS